MSALAAPPLHIAPFVNEPYTDFQQPQNAERMRNALTKVRGEFGKEYDLLIAGERRKSESKLQSVNPSRPSEIVGIHQKGSEQDARDAVERAAAYFPTWAEVPAESRAAMLFRVAEIIRERKYEFDAWLVYEAGKTWIEAEGDVSEAIDFCNYYARQALKLANPEPVVQLSGERDEMVYLPLGVGVIIPPWNFPLAILVGMATAALVVGNTVVIKPSSDTPTIAAKFAEVLLQAGFPPQSFSLLTGSGGAIGDILVSHPKTRFVSFTGSRDVGLHINELAAKTPKGQLWIKRVVAEMGGKDAIIVDRETDIDQAVLGVLYSAFGYQGQKCSACSRAIVDESIYDEFLNKLKAKAEALTVGPSDEINNYMGPVINSRAKESILKYIELGKSEGRLIAGGEEVKGDGYFIRPTVIADVGPEARIFQEEIFGPVLAITKARDFDHALQLTNDSEYGLTGAVFSVNPAKLDKAKRQFFVGNL
ncbi:MAG: L-glutamate gamma-semialdehyde dehydrogenase, partial [Acidobacteriaceae bacterium]|nr:L-glutamate gamma-semialdehyde dehydrogenase [Acidobacteriaceae bacterium]